MKEKLNNIIYLPGGVHANEEINSIVERKIKEINKNGFMFFGYNGTLLHPNSQVVPFGKKNHKNNNKTYVLISAIKKDYQKFVIKAKDYTINRVEWFDIPENINVLGSKYALVCSNIKPCSFDIDLNDYVIARGKHKNERFAEVYSTRLDSVCAHYNPENKKEINKKIVHIDYIAELTEPYGVFVR
jgi:hypothetical protein